MEEEDRRGFKFDLDAPVSPEEIPEQKSGGQSNTRAIALLLTGFVIVGILTVWMYYDFNHRLDAVNSMGSAELANISGQLKGQISAVSGQLAGQQETVQKKMANLESEVSRLSKSVTAMDAAKSDKKEFKDAIDRMDGLTKEISTQLAELARKNQSLSETVSTLSAQMQGAQADLRDIAENLKTAAENSVKKEALEAALAKERESVSKHMAHATEVLSNEIADLNKNLKLLNERVAAVEAAKPASTGAAPKQVPILPDPEPGNIVEQEITH